MRGRWFVSSEGRCHKQMLFLVLHSSSKHGREASLRAPGAGLPHFHSLMLNIYKIIVFPKGFVTV